MPTWSDIKAEIMDEYDLNDEVFVDEDELLVWANDAIEDIEKEIHLINDKYFETETDLSVTSGSSEFSLPSDIYANKITGVFFDDGSDKYEILPVTDKKTILDVNSSDNYRYRIVNSTASGVKIKFYPDIRTTSSDDITLHYIRNATRMTEDASELNIPESRRYVKQYVIEKAANKERMTPDAPPSAELMRIRKNLLDSFENMLDDDNNEVGVDFSYYHEAV